MWDHETIMMIVQGVGETLYMTVLSTVLGYLFGLPMGVLLAVSDKEGLKPNAVLYKILDAIANIVRSIPFFQNFLEVSYDFIFVIPVILIYMRLQISKHILNFQVCSTMTRSLQRSDGCSSRRVGICP